MNKPLLILISGPYMTGTDGDEAMIAKNLREMEAMALPIYRKGHVAVVGEWISWPIIKSAGGMTHQSPEFKEFQCPVAHRLLEICDVVLRIPGASKGADLEMEKARQMGKSVYLSIDEVPTLTDAS